jgi:putative ATPase
MVRAGEDPSFIFRRMIILASEDVGLADPHALTVVISCAQAFDRIGFPEGNFPLAHAALYLATAPKSNTTMAFFDALGEVEKEDAEVPNHLRDASRDKESFGHGEGYIYPHAYRDHWAAQQYLPRVLRGKTFYSPSQVGYEGRIREEVLRKREIQAAVILGDDEDGEFLSWSAAAKGREGWFKRLESGRSALLLSDRDAILGQCAIVRHDRILIGAANDGLLLWECLRRAPEGLSAALVDTESARETLLRYARTLPGTEPASPAPGGPDEPEAPRIAVFPAGGLPAAAEAEEWFSCALFDHILAREPWKKGFGGLPADAAFRSFAEGAGGLLAPGGALVLLASPPRLGERLSRLIREECPAAGTLAARLGEAEEAFFSPQAGEDAARWTWDQDTLEGAFKTAGFKTRITVLEQREERLLTGRDIALWFDQDRSSWGAFIGKTLGQDDFFALRDLLGERAKQGPVLWKWRSLLLKGTTADQQEFTV